MGVDAQGYFRVKGQPVTPDFLALLNAELWERFDDDELGRERQWEFFKPLQHHYDFENDPQRANIGEIDFDGARLWAPHYERGNFLAQITVLGFLRRFLPVGSEVFFGGDTENLEEMDEWTDFEEQAFLNHWLANGHFPYRSGFTA